MDLLKALSEIAGAPGREERVRDLIKTHVDPVADEVTTDAMGNLFATVRAKVRSDRSQKVMLACHMDEIAFYARNVDAKGFIRLQQLGGFDVRNLFARRVLIQTRSGDIVGSLNPVGRPIHVQTEEDRKRNLRIIDLFVDTGLPADEVRKRVRPGDPVTLIQDFRDLGQVVTGKCMDNRVACWTGIRVLERIAEAADLAHDVVVCFTVQEEIGVRGALAGGYSVNPDVAIAVDVTLAIDQPGIPEEEQITHLGQGAAIKIMDSYSISDRELVDAFIDVAEVGGIPYQLEILPLGGTDAGAIQRARGGCKAITISVPCRYVHTVTETVHKDDLHGAVNLIVAWLDSSGAA
jgi:tetrahedral aminopeptidase